MIHTLYDLQFFRKEVVYNIVLKSKLLENCWERYKIKKRQPIDYQLSYRF
jgi:hypothetical protein